MKIHVFENKQAYNEFKARVQAMPKAERRLNHARVIEHGLHDAKAKGWPRVAVEHWFMSDCELHYIDRDSALQALTKLQTTPKAPNEHEEEEEFPTEDTDIGDEPEDDCDDDSN
jgi:hypothetical protein